MSSWQFTTFFVALLAVQFIGGGPLLPHTPLRAIGINIVYKFNRTDDYFMIKTMNSLRCQMNDFELDQMKFTKRFDNYQLNIITTIENEQFSINFNYHYVNVTMFIKDIEANKIDIISNKISDSIKLIKNE
ncbi:hypothetical protein ACFLSA_00840 [Bacteroidota bacterium]